MEPLERLLAIEDIKQLKARYFRCVDTKDWEGFADVFAPDAELDVSWSPIDGNPVLRGNRAIMEHVRRHAAELSTVHHGLTPEIEVISSTEARGLWAMEDIVHFPEDGDVASMHGYGHYHETYHQIDGQWRIASSELTRLRMDFETR